MFCIAMLPLILLDKFLFCFLLLLLLFLIKWGKPTGFIKIAKYQTAGMKHRFFAETCLYEISGVHDAISLLLEILYFHNISCLFNGSMVPPSKIRFVQCCFLICQKELYCQFMQ